MTTTDFTPSPCIRKCSLNEAQICRGCFRSIQEIMDWSSMLEAEKQATVIRCKTRRRERASLFRR